MSVDTTAQVLTATEARALTDQIRQTLRIGHDLIIRAFAGRAWTALGYDSWDAYCAGEFSEARMVRLDREQRREIVAEMRQAGMSTPAIGAALGVSKSTVHNDLPVLEAQGVELPDKITRTDGRSNAAAWSRPDCDVHVDTATGEITDEPPTQSQAPRQNRRPLPDAFFDVAFDLTKVIERVARLVDDDRFPQNAEKVAAKHRSDLIRARDVLSGVIARLPAA